ncbi:MAG: SGNH/GDSL hydrolase family protein [Microbacter sp.]
MKIAYAQAYDYLESSIRPLKINYLRMKRQNKIIVSFLFLLFTASTVLASNRFVPFNNEWITYQGRIFFRPQGAVLSWSGCGITFRFKGSCISAIMQDSDTGNYYNVILDGKWYAKIHTDTLKHAYLLASGLKWGKHTMKLFKRTEWDKGKTQFFGFELPEHAVGLPPLKEPKRKMKFYGNSITCGYGVEDPNGNNSSLGCFENNYVTYAAITARHFHAQYRCIAKSGIGIMVSWFPLIMPEMFDRIDPTDSIHHWNFALYQPDVVVINLFQNDSWLVNKPNNPQFIHRFGSRKPDKAFIVGAYQQFVQSIRQKYPHASIVCVLGDMDATKTGSPWPGYITEAVSQMHDPHIYVHFFPYKNRSGHPNVAEQQAMANSLIHFINKKIH